MTDHIADVSKKVLSAEQTRFMAEMYAEQHDIRKYQIIEDALLGDGIAWKERPGRKRVVRFNDFNICLGVLEKWAKGPCESYNLYYSGGHYKLTLMVDIGDLEPHAIENSDPSLPIAIAEALMKMQE